VDEHRVELIVPTFEEALYLAQHRDELDYGAPVFAPSPAPGWWQVMSYQKVLE